MKRFYWPTGIPWRGSISAALRLVSEFLMLSLVIGVPVGVGIGLAGGWHYLRSGVPRVVPYLLGDAVEFSLLGSLAFSIIFLSFAGILDRRLPPKISHLLSVALALAPLLATGAWHFAHSWGISKAYFLRIQSLPLTAAVIGGFVIATLALWLWRSRSLRMQSRTRIALCLSLLGVAGLTQLPRLLGDSKDPLRNEKPDIIFIVIDSLRPDHLSCYGYGRDTSPAIDAFAKDGVVFAQAVSQSTFTGSSIASLLTARNPHQHGLYWGSLKAEDGAVTSHVLRPEEVTLPEVLRHSGYLTAAFVENSVLRPSNGFDQGFVSYNDRQGSIGRIAGRFNRWVRGPGRAYPFFAYLHVLDLHDPYRPQPPYDTLYGGTGNPYGDFNRYQDWLSFIKRTRSGERKLSNEELGRVVSLYDGQVRFVDDALSRLFHELKRAGVYDTSMIVLAADHGDALMEHGFLSHSYLPYDELCKVPLIIKFPHDRYAGTSVAHQVRLIDVMPTVLEELHVEAPGRIDGCSLMRHLGMSDRAGVDSSKCELALTEIAVEGRSLAIAVRNGRYKYIYREGAEGELYDLSLDPREKTNLHGSDYAIEATLREIAADAAKKGASLKSNPVPVDDKTVRDLKALGYVE